MNLINTQISFRVWTKLEVITSCFRWMFLLSFKHRWCFSHIIALYKKKINLIFKYASVLVTPCSPGILQALQSLSLADSRLRQRGTVLVNALGSNACLRKVDLSGNLLEDSGAKMLSKALQINTTLRCVCALQQ